MSHHYDILRSIRQNNRLYQSSTVMQLAPTPILTSHPVIENQGNRAVVLLDAENQLTIEIPKWYQLWANSRFFMRNRELKPEKLKLFAKSRKTRLTQLGSGQTVFLKFSKWGDPLPDIYLDERPIHYKEQQNWIEKAFIFFPLALLMACRGGLFPALVCFTGLAINIRLSRLPYTKVQRLWLTALANICTVVIGYLLVGSFLALMLLCGLNPFPQ